MNVLWTLGRFGLFCATLLGATLSHPPPVRDSIAAGYHIGVRSLPVLLIISAFVGTNLALQGYNAFRPLGGQQLVGMFVALAGIRELAPLMVAAMVAAKAGTEMASELAVMRIRDQIDALEVMAVSPHWYLITPRLFGISLVLPPLTVLSIFTLVAAAWSVSVFQLGLNGHTFLDLAAQTTSGTDLVYCGIKAAVFGIIICLVSCFYGFGSAPGAQGVGKATNGAVVVSAIGCAVVNYLLSAAFYP